MNRRPGRTATLLAGALVVLATLTAWYDLAGPVVVGIGGGLLACLVIVGLDALHSAQARARPRGSNGSAGGRPPEAGPASHQPAEPRPQAEQTDDG